MCNTQIIAEKPKHVGVIMDGNGRWAMFRGQSRTQGHKEGLNAAKRVVRGASLLGIEYLTLYTFSTENWSRAAKEVSFLMKMLGTYLRREYDFYREYNIRIVHSGDTMALPPNVQRELSLVQRDTAHFDGMVVNLAVNYGGRDEIVRAMHRWQNNGGASGKPLDINTLGHYLDQPGFPDPELIIRTGGEKRISNFMLWECAYSEFIFSDKLWPDWCEEDVSAAVQEYQTRKRNFGGVRYGH